MRAAVRTRLTSSQGEDRGLDTVTTPGEVGQQFVAEIQAIVTDVGG